MNARRISLTLLALFGMIVPAAVAVRALPGQKQTQLVAWMQSNPALQGFAAGRDEMSGGTVYHANVRENDLMFTFGAIAGNGVTSYEETLSVRYVGKSYDLQSHRPIAISMVRAVYGDAIANDFGDAPMVGDFAIYQSQQRNLIARGQLFAYSISGPTLTIFPSSGIDQALRRAKACAIRECGD